jgi:hypothetical protein
LFSLHLTSPHKTRRDMNTPTDTAHTPPRRLITAAQIKRARELRAAGLTLQQIRAELTEGTAATTPSLSTISRYTRGLKPPRPKGPRKRTPRTREQRARESAKQSAQRREERLAESPQEKAERRAYNRLIYAAWIAERRARETPAERESRLERERMRSRERRQRARAQAQAQEEGPRP